VVCRSGPHRVRDLLGQPDERLAEKSFDSYLLEGTMAAVDAIVEQTGAKEINAAGYCLGGTLLATTLAYMAAKKDKRIASGTFFTTMTDFADPGELSVFIDEGQINSLEKKMFERGYLEGSEMAGTFNMLRANDLIWSFVVNNYLMGKDPFPFDLLYWNSDSTRMPAKMHSFYLRNMYLRTCSRSRVASRSRRAHRPLQDQGPDLLHLHHRRPHRPVEEHLPGALNFGGNVRFVLGGSGHIAGIVNPPAANKYGYWTTTAASCPPPPTSSSPAPSSSRAPGGPTGRPGCWPRTPRCRPATPSRATSRFSKTHRAPSSRLASTQEAA
jgi:polyhydroxyalkanoate synthase